MRKTESFIASLDAWMRANQVREGDIAEALGLTKAGFSRMKSRPADAAQRALVRVLCRLGPRAGIAMIARGPDTDTEWSPDLARRLDAYVDGSRDDA